MSKEGFGGLTFRGIPIVWDTEMPKHEGTVTFFDLNNPRALEFLRRIAEAEGIEINASSL